MKENIVNIQAVRNQNAKVNFIFNDCNCQLSTEIHSSRELSNVLDNTEKPYICVPLFC